MLGGADASSAGHGAGAGGQLLGDVAHGLAVLGESAHDLVLFGRGELRQADAASAEREFDGDLVDVVEGLAGRGRWFGVVVVPGEGGEPLALRRHREGVGDGALAA